MTTVQRPPGITNWPICRTSALLLAAALLGFGDVRAEVAVKPDQVTAVAPDGNFDQRPADPVPAIARPKKENSLTGNPLWGVSLDALSETRARPIFSPSRRPPPPAVAAVPSPAPAKPAAEEPEQPQLTLLGTVIGDSTAIGIFLDRTSQEMVRLKLGEHHLGWMLRSVRRGMTSLAKNHTEAMLTLPRPGAEPTGQSVTQGVAKPPEARLCGGGHPDACASPAVSAVPTATPGTGSARKARREI